MEETLRQLLTEETAKIEKINAVSFTKEDFEEKIFAARKLFRRISSIETEACRLFGSKRFNGDFTYRAQLVLNELRLNKRYSRQMTGGVIGDGIRLTDGIIYGRKLA